MCVQLFDVCLTYLRAAVILQVTKAPSQRQDASYSLTIRELIPGYCFTVYDGMCHVEIVYTCSCYSFILPLTKRKHFE